MNWAKWHYHLPGGAVKLNLFRASFLSHVRGLTRKPLSY